MVERLCKHRDRAEILSASAEKAQNKKDVIFECNNFKGK